MSLTVERVLLQPYLKHHGFPNISKKKKKKESLTAHSYSAIILEIELLNLKIVYSVMSKRYNQN